ncbi:hypothetical protein [Ferrithrix thermotolerans]|uniref:hypothetical protein n=1 Tax=Ferrithrix thermotolerans TaxID=209649 RepID=UPI0015B8AB3A|nr:hypothetical protein [Ferrithrix thermotolerans]
MSAAYTQGSQILRPVGTDIAVLSALQRDNEDLCIERGGVVVAVDGHSIAGVVALVI